MVDPGAVLGGGEGFRDEGFILFSGLNVPPYKKAGPNLAPLSKLV